MKFESLNTLFPSFVMTGKLDELTHDENEALADIAWEVWDMNIAFEKKYTDVKSVGEFYKTTKTNLLLSHGHLPVVKKYISLINTVVREYLKFTYHYEHRGDIDIIVDPFCQKSETGTYGVMPHRHYGKPIVVTYYPRIIKETVEYPWYTASGVNGETNFYDPSGVGKRPWPNKNPAFLVGENYQVMAETGSFVVFEGYMPHDSVQFTGKERVCMPAMCHPILENKATPVRFGYENK